MQSRANIPRDSYSNKSGLNKLNVCKASQVNLDKEPILYENYGNRFEPKRSNRFRKYKEPDVYNADNTEWPDYLCHFEQVAMWNEWTDAEKATQLSMSLRGRAQRVLSELSYRELGNYSELKCALTQRFSLPERETAHRCEFRTRRRKSGETVSEYGYSLRRLAESSLPNISV